MADRGREIKIEDVIRIEDTRTKPRYSVTGYEEELNWIKELIESHLRRIEAWRETATEHRHCFGKLDEYLKEFEEV